MDVVSCVWSSRSLRDLYCRDNDLSEMDIPQSFVVERDRFGKLVHKELKQNGQNEVVTNDNKEEYVRQVVSSTHQFLPRSLTLSLSPAQTVCAVQVQRWHREQFLALQKGFHELIPAQLLREFDERELELLISGLGKVDVVDWRNNTRLKNCTPDTSAIRWFWQAVESYDDEKRARLLQFVTGSSRVPLDGFKALQGGSSPTHTHSHSHTLSLSLCLRFYWSSRPKAVHHPHSGPTNTQPPQGPYMVYTCSILSGCGHNIDL